MKKKAIHMKFLNHSIGFCLLLTLLCYSCASDYLDTAPTNQDLMPYLPVVTRSICGIITTK